MILTAILSKNPISQYVEQYKINKSFKQAYDKSYTEFKKAYTGAENTPQYNAFNNYLKN
jgi:hypothetical protein